MYNVMIVDDEAEILEGLVNMLDWASYGMKVAATAKNGEEALAAASILSVDILLTDITMPTMSGLDLVRQMKVLYPHVKSILVTCHQSFDFAKEAMSIGVEDYIVKHTVTGEELRLVLEKAIRQIEDERKRKERLNKAEGSYRNNTNAIIQSYFDELLQGRANGHEDAITLAKGKGISVPLGPNTLAGVFIDDYRSALKVSGINDWNLLKFCITNVMGEIFEDQPLLLYFWHEDSNLYLLSLYEVTQGLSGHQALLEKLQKKVRELFQFEVSVCLGGVNEGLSEFESKVKSVEKLRDCYFYSKGGRIVVEGVFRPEDYGTVDGTHIHSEFVKKLHTGDQVQVRSFLESMAQEMRLKNVAPSSVRVIVRGLITDLQAEGNRHGVHIQSMEEISFTFERIMEGLITSAVSYVEAVQEKIDKTYRPEIAQVVTYIERHIGEKITCNMMADMQNMNRSYFSRMFKQETGASFRDYVTEKRLNFALGLLKETDDTIEEVSLVVGFENVANFSRMIKNKTGMTPNQLRR